MITTSRPGCPASRRRARRSRRTRSGGCSRRAARSRAMRSWVAVAELLDRVRDLHVEEARRVVQALQVVCEPEDRRALRRLVAADALEDAGAVVEAVHADVHLGVGPVDELAVHPDLVGLVHQALRVRGLVSARAGNSPESIPHTSTYSWTMSTVVPRVRRTSSSGDTIAMWRSDPAPTQTTVLERIVRSTRTGTPAGGGNGATAPGREARRRHDLGRTRDARLARRRPRARSSPGRRGGLPARARARAARRRRTRAT